MISRFLLIWMSVFATCVVAQDNGTPQTGVQLRKIDLTQVAPLEGIPMTGATAYPFTCSSDGDVYAGVLVFDQDGRPVSTIPDLYKVSAHAVSKHISKPLPTGYKHLDSPSFFAGDRMLVTVIRAAMPSEEPTRVGTDYFLSITDSDGDHPKLLRLNLKFSVSKAAVFGSGEFIVLGSNSGSAEPTIALLNADGEFTKFVELPELPEGKVSSAKDDKEAPKHLNYSIGAAHFAPWGSDILLVMPGVDGSSIYRFRASGEMQKVKIKLPQNQQLSGVLGAGGRDTWVIRTVSAEGAKTIEKVHLVENPKEFLYEVNPRDGEILRRLDVSGPNPGEVACAADGKLAAIYVALDSPHGPDKFVFATAPR